MLAPQERGRSMSGWYKMHRGWMNSSIFDGEPFCKRAAWEYLIHEAAFDDHGQWFNGKLIQIKRGQFVVSERRLAEVWKWDRQRVRTFLKQLERDQKLTRAQTHGLTQITICNYCKFQSSEPTAKPSGKPTSNPELTQSQPTTEERKEGKEGKEGKKKSSFELPDWVSPTSWSEWEAHRKEIKSPLTDVARARCVKVLEEAVQAGFSVEETIDQSIVSGWRGLFVPKGKARAAASPQSDVLRRLTAEAMRSAGGAA